MNIVQIGLKGHQGLCLSEIARRPDASLVAIWDDDPALLAGAAKLPGVNERTVITANLDELLARRDVDVAVLAEDNAARAENAIACARRGWHLCCEKPLATSLAQLDELRRVIDESGVRLTMLLTMRFEPVYRAMREAIRGGAIGRPLNLSAQKSYKLGQRPAWQRDPRRYGGTIPFIGIHPVDMLHYVTGCDYRRVAATALCAALPGSDTMDESCALLAETTDGAPVSIRLDFLRPQTAPSHGDDRVRVAGSTGVIEVLGGECRLLTGSAPPQVLPLPATAPDLFGQFLDALGGTAQHDITAAECFRASEIVLRAQQAATSRGWVEVPPPPA